MLPDSLIESLSQLWIGAVLRDSRWMLPTVETIHLVCYSIIFGAMLTRNLRAFGLGIRESSPAQIGAQLRSWMFAGLVGSIVTGTLLFLYEPSRFGVNYIFGYKMALVFPAALFEFTVRSKINRSAARERSEAAVSAILWLGVVLAGLMVSLT
jgi:hypothetical protein